LIDKPFPCKSVFAELSHSLTIVHFDINDNFLLEAQIKLIWPRINAEGVLVVSAYASISQDSLNRLANEFALQKIDGVCI
jgi:NADPH-dependent curcumin reductase CurA